MNIEELLSTWLQETLLSIGIMGVPAKIHPVLLDYDDEAPQCAYVSEGTRLRAIGDTAEAVQSDFALDAAAVNAHLRVFRVIVASSLFPHAVEMGQKLLTEYRKQPGITLVSHPYDVIGDFSVKIFQRVLFVQVRSEPSKWRLP